MQLRGPVSPRAPPGPHPKTTQAPPSPPLQAPPLASSRPLPEPPSRPPPGLAQVPPRPPPRASQSPPRPPPRAPARAPPRLPLRPPKALSQACNPLRLFPALCQGLPLASPLGSRAVGWVRDASCMLDGFACTSRPLKCAPRCVCGPLLSHPLSLRPSMPTDCRWPLGQRYTRQTFA